MQEMQCPDFDEPQHTRLDGLAGTASNPTRAFASTRKGVVMGILDSLESSGILGQLGAAVLPAVLGEVMGSGGQGGLNAIVAKLQQSGLGDIEKSWVGPAQTLPISADQLKQVLGSDVVRQLA